MAHGESAGKDAEYAIVLTGTAPAPMWTPTQFIHTMTDDKKQAQDEFERIKGTLRHDENMRRLYQHAYLYELADSFAIEDE